MGVIAGFLLVKIVDVAFEGACDPAQCPGGWRPLAFLDVIDCGVAQARFPGQVLLRLVQTLSLLDDSGWIERLHW